MLIRAVWCGNTAMIVVNINLVVDVVHPAINDSGDESALHRAKPLAAMTLQYQLSLTSPAVVQPVAMSSA